MNRQTLAVTIGTVALLLIAIVLLYASPSPEPNPPVRPNAGGQAKVKAKRPRAPAANRLPAAKLIHKREIPDDRPAAPSGAPNVVVIVPSTQRKDQWSLYGGPENTTPFIASQVQRYGVKMADALSVAVSPHENAVALVTGHLPHELGAIEPSQKRNGRPLPRSVHTMAEHFSRAGWFAMGVSANHHFNARMGQFQGFDWYRDSQPFSLMKDRRIPARQAVRFALRRVAERSEAEQARPLYLQIALVDSHKPFRVAPKDFEPFVGPDHEIAPYRATIRMQDDAISDLVQGLSEVGITHENTLFVVVSDQGEGLNMPQHHREQHGFVLYQSVVQIPWVMWGPGLPKNAEVKGLASTIDVAPTVVALAGLGAEGFQGMSHAAAVRAGGATKRTEAYADTLFRGAHRASLWTPTRQCQKDYGSTFTLLDDAFVDGCFDRQADPDFLAPIEDAALMARLESEHARLMALVAKGEEAEDAGDEGAVEGDPE